MRVITRKWQKCQVPSTKMFLCFFSQFLSLSAKLFKPTSSAWQSIKAHSSPHRARTRQTTHTISHVNLSACQAVKKSLCIFFWRAVMQSINVSLIRNWVFSCYFMYKKVSVPCCLASRSAIDVFINHSVILNIILKSDGDLLSFYLLVYRGRKWQRRTD